MAKSVETTGAPRLHVRTRQALEVRDAVERRAPQARAVVGWPRRGWTTVQPLEASFDSHALASELSLEVAPVVVLGEGPDGCLIASLVEGGAHVLDIDGSTRPERLPPAFREATAERLSARVAEHPRRRRLRAGRAADFVARMSRQVDAEVGANLAWLRRHAALTGVAPPPGPRLAREEERALVAQAMERLREPTGREAAECRAARAEMESLLEGQREAFHAMVAEHAELLGVPAPPTPEAADSSYFARVERILFEHGDPRSPDTSDGVSGFGPGDASGSGHEEDPVVAVALLLGIDPSHARPQCPGLASLAELPRDGTGA